MIISMKKMRLRQLCQYDANSGMPYAEWLADPEVIRFLECRLSPAPTQLDLATYIQTHKPPEYLFLAIEIKDWSWIHIGNIKLGPISCVHRTADIGIMIGAKDQWGKGYGVQAIKLLAHHAFVNLNLHKLTASCYAVNKGSMAAFSKAGFRVEACREAQFFCEGQYVGCVHFAALAESWLDWEKENG